MFTKDNNLNSKELKFVKFNVAFYKLKVQLKFLKN